MNINRVNIPGYSAYEISEDGVVVPKNPLNGRGAAGMLSHPNHEGYLQLSLRGDDGEKHTVTVHGIMARAFLGVRPHGFVVNHKDGDKTNCHKSNLEYITPSENNLHAYKNGLATRTNAKLTVEGVERILDLIDAGMKNGDIAKAYGVSVSTVHLIRHGARWGSVRASKRGKRA